MSSITSNSIFTFFFHLLPLCFNFFVSVHLSYCQVGLMCSFFLIFWWNALFNLKSIFDEFGKLQKELVIHLWPYQHKPYRIILLAAFINWTLTSYVIHILYGWVSVPKWKRSEFNWLLCYNHCDWSAPEADKIVSLIKTENNRF